MKKRLLAFSLCFIMLFSLAACSSKKEEAGGDSLSETKPLVVAYPTDPEGLDPQRTSAVSTFNITGNIYEPLLAVTPDWEIEPRLAESYTISEDGLSISFKLNEGVLFHNGREMTADDVIFSFERLKGEESPKASSYANIVSMEATDNYNVTFTLAKPDNELEKSFAYPWAVIVPEEAADDLKTNPVGTGAYKFVSWVAQEGVTLERFDDYYGEKANIKTVELKLIPDYTSSLASLQAKDVDITEISGDQIELLEGLEGFKVYTEPLNATQLLALNMDNEILSNLKVRQAIAMAIDKDAIIDAVVWGYGDKVGSHLPVISPDYIDTTDIMPYDVTAAKALLAEAGYPDGFTIKLTLPKNYQIHVDTGQIIANQLSAIGINAEIELVEWGEWYDTVYSSKNYDMTVVALSGRLDSGYFLKRYISTSGDFVSLITGEVDGVLAQAANEADSAARTELFQEAQKILAEKLPAVFIQTPHKMFGMNDKVEGLRIYPIDIYEYKDVYYVK